MKLPGRGAVTLGSGSDALAFPEWIGLAMLALATATSIVAVAERGVTPLSIAVAVVGILPWALHLRWKNLPPWVFVVLATGAVSYLGRRPESAAYFLLMLMIGQIATTCSTLNAALAGGVGLAMVLVHMARAAQPIDSPHSWVAWVVACGISWVTGSVFRHQMILNTRLRAAQADLVATAAVGERQRIAREVHDVIAHSLTVTMLHLTGARLTLEHDPAATGDAIAALNEAERLGRQSLTEIRRTVGLLASDGTSPSTAPLPGVTDLGELVDSYRSAGMTVTLTMEGSTGDVSLASGLALYRILQESLTNAAKHAPGVPTEVRLTIDEHAVAFIVENVSNERGVRSGPDGGMGVRGMAARAQTLGGRLDAGPSAGGRWVVSGSIPLDAGRAPSPVAAPQVGVG